MAIVVATANLLLTFFLVPFAGVKGAAGATMLTMLLYFGLFGNDLPKRYRIRKYHYAIAGLALYLVHMLLARFGAPAVDFWLGPVLLGVLFYLSGLYGTSGRSASTLNRTQPANADPS
jgi:O-antigen/teichoic acid export membrane protein